MAKVIGTIVVEIQKCKGCGICVTACPQDVIQLSNDVNSKGFNFAEMKNDACTGCVNCALVCPDSVITVYRKKI